MFELTVHEQGRHTVLPTLHACLDEGGKAARIPDLSVHTRVVVEDVVDNSGEACRRHEDNMEMNGGVIRACVVSQLWCNIPAWAAIMRAELPSLSWWFMSISGHTCSVVTMSTHPLLTATISPL